MPDRKFPPSVDPRNASVFDSTMTATMRKLAAALESGELAQVAGAASPAIARVPKEAAEVLVPRLLANWRGWAEQNQTEIPAAVETALEYLVEKFPRMASHLHSVNRLAADMPKKVGEFLPEGSGSGRVGQVYVKENLGFLDALETLSHEFTHGGQALRAESRGQPFLEAYARQKNIWGYPKNPYEIRAREAMLNQRYRFTYPNNENKLNRAFAKIDAGGEIP